MTRLFARRNSGRRAFSAVALTALTGGLLAGGGASYAGQPRVVVQPLVISSLTEAPDYATTAFADPWDYSNVEDMKIYGAGRIQGGQLLFKAGDGFPANLVPYVPGAHAIGRDGPAAPIDGRRYTDMSMRLYSSNKGSAAVLWSTCDWANVSCRGSKNFPVQQGWNLIHIPMSQSANWTRVVALKLLPTNIAGTQMRLDWARLYAPAPGVDVAWIDESPGHAATVYWDTDPDQSNNTPDNPGWGEVAKVKASSAVNTTAFDAAAFPPGAYYFYVVTADGASAYTSALAVVPRPRPVVLTPSMTSGADYATVVRKNAWDMSQPGDGVPQFASASFRGGVMSGRNVGNNRDPALTLAVPTPIVGSQYHYAQFRMWIEGPFSIGFEPGGGSLARLTWKVAGSSVWQNTNDMVLYPGWNDITIDLATSPATKIVETDQAGKIGWAGKQIVTMRLDPNEDIGKRNWRVDFVRLTETPTARGAYNISFVDSAAQPDSTYEVYADKKFGTYGGTLLASGLPVAQGGAVTKFHWDPNLSVAAGTYWIWVRVKNSVGETKRYSNAPLKMTPLSGTQ
jgi:hypothetical protein